MNMPGTNNFSENQATFGENYSSNPFKSLFTLVNTDNGTQFSCNESPCILDRQAWAEIFYHKNLFLLFVDLFGQDLSPAASDFLRSTLYEFKITLQISNQYQLYYDSNCTQSYCKINGDDLTMRGLGNQTISLAFNITNTQFPSFDFVVMASFRPCKIGEINDTRQSICTPCETNTYSLNTSDEVCHPCPTNARCLGGAVINPLPGYWKPQQYSTNIYPCSRPEVCDITSYGSNICAAGYTGPFCLACDLQNNYAQAGNECSQCLPLWKGILILGSIQFLIFILEIGYIWYFRKINKSLIKDNKYNKKFVDRVARGGYMTIMLDYLQMITILKSYPLLLSGFIAGLSHIGSPSQTLLYSADCVFMQLGVSIENLFYAKLVAIIILPVLKFMLCIIFGLAKKFIYTHYRFDVYLIVAAQCLILIEQPSMLYTLASALVCESNDPLTKDQTNISYYLRENPYVTCYTSKYYTYRNFVAIPVLFIWGIVFPICFAIILRSNRTKLKTEEFAMKFGSQYANYRSKYYYWNLIQLIQKFVLIFFAQFAMLPLKTQGLTFFVILMVFIAIINKFQPYRSVDLQTTYITSTYVILFTTFLAVYGYEEESLNEVISILIIILNAAFIAYIVLKVLHLMGFRWVSRFIQAIFNKFSKRSKKIGFIFDDSYNHTGESVIHYHDRDKDHRASMLERLIAFEKQEELTSDQKEESKEQ